MSVLRRRETWGAAAFVAMLAVGALLLISGLLNTAPARTGVSLPQRTDYVRHLRVGLGRRNPRREGISETVTTPAPEDVITSAISAADNSANQVLDRDHWFIQFYGGVQDLLLHRMTDDTDDRYDVVKLSDGTLTFVNREPLDTTGHALSTVRLRDQLEKRDIPLLYVQAPQKIKENDDRLPDGVPDYGNAYADQFLSVLKEHGVASLDLRKTFEADGADWSSLFFRTDHHWNVAAAFRGVQAICDTLRSDYGYSIPARYTSASHYTVENIPQCFLGSQGKRVGMLYGGLDDIQLWRPDFFTDLTYSVPYYEIKRAGSFDQAVLFPEKLREKDLFQANLVALYAGGDFPMARARNLDNPNGPRILLLRDSYACAATPFLALGCSELITIDLRYFHDDLMTYVDWLKPDLVMVLYTAGSTSLDPLFTFFSSSDLLTGALREETPLASMPPAG